MGPFFDVFRVKCKVNLPCIKACLDALLRTRPLLPKLKSVFGTKFMIKDVTLFPGNYGMGMSLVFLYSLTFFRAKGVFRAKAEY